MYTKGPWTVLPAVNYNGFAIAPMGTLPTLASVERPAGARSKTIINCFNFPGETEANANLIAAAPELLEILEKMLQRYGYETCEYVQIAQAVINKAKGNKP